MPGTRARELFDRYSPTFAAYADRLAKRPRMAPKVDYILIPAVNRPIDFSKKPGGPMLTAFPVGWPLVVDNPTGLTGTFETAYLLAEDGWLLFHEPQPYWTPLQRLIPLSRGGTLPHAVAGNWPIGNFDWDDADAVQAAIDKDYFSREDPAYVGRIVARSRRGN